MFNWNQNVAFEMDKSKLNIVNMWLFPLDRVTNMKTWECAIHILHCTIIQI